MQQMQEKEKIVFYDRYKLIIHPSIKTQSHTKPLWRKLFWTTAKNSDQYKIGCVDIFTIHFPELYQTLKENKEKK